MHAVIRRYRLAAGVDAAEVLAHVQRGFVPLIAQAPGFVAFHALSTGDGGVVSVSVFASEAGAEASTRRAADHVAQELTPYFAGPPTIEQGEVGAHAISASGGHPVSTES